MLELKNVSGLADVTKRPPHLEPLTDHQAAATGLACDMCVCVGVFEGEDKVPFDFYALPNDFCVMSTPEMREFL